jgi:hypothetical protein
MEPEKKMNGAVVGLIIIIIILLVGGVYIWQSKVKSVPPEGQTEVSPTDEEDLDSLEQDVNSVDTEIEANVIDSVE